MTYLHSCGVAHRDLKLDNILIEDAVPPRLVVIDFGLCGRIET
jgi:serine/threonine protein kinase